MDHAPSPAGLTPVAPPTRTAPWYFSLARRLPRRNVRGSTRLMGTLDRLGLLPDSVYYDVGRGIRFAVPIRRAENQWDRLDVLYRGRQGILQFARLCSELGGPVRLIDCGADIGIVSMQLTLACEAIDEVVAIEPNSTAYPYLARNVASLPFEATAYHAAVGDVSGFGRLVAPPDQAADNEHGWYIEPDDDGPIRLMTVDDIERDGSRAVGIKIDVEGLELAVVRGAERTLTEASACAIVFEAHPDVIRRTGVDPAEVLKYLLSLRDWRYFVAEHPDRELELDRPFFEQFDERICFNVVATTRS